MMQSARSVQPKRKAKPRAAGRTRGSKNRRRMDEAEAKPRPRQIAETPYAAAAGAPATYNPQPASHNSIKESATDPHSFSMALHFNWRTKKKPGAKAQTTSSNTNATDWKKSTR